jgi:hypothetical protein
MQNGGTMAILVNFDISGRHTDFKQQMIQMGYADTFMMGGTVYTLPNTTLCHHGKNKPDGLQDLKNVAARLQVRLERALVTELEPLEAIPGDRR